MDRISQQPGKNPIICLDYKDLVKNPIATMKKTYDYYNLKWTDSVENGMLNYIANDPKKKKYGKHRYSLEDYGLTRDQLDEQFHEYANFYKDKTNDIII